MNLQILICKAKTLGDQPRKREGDKNGTFYLLQQNVSVELYIN